MDITSETSPQRIYVSKKAMILVVFGWIVTLLWTFGGGFFLRQILSGAEGPKPVTTTNPVNISPAPTFSFPDLGNAQSIDFIEYFHPEFAAEQSYFNDTLTVLVESTPPQLIISTYTVGQSGDTFSHTARASYFDGEEWHRNVDSKQGSSTRFIPNTVIASYRVFQDRNRVLRQRIDSTLNIDDIGLEISTDVLENEIPMRTEPTYTRVVSDSTGTVRVNGVEYPARVMYTKWYSMDQSKLSFYNSDYGLKTHVVDFWAEDGSVFHLDSTQVKNPDEIYSSHQIGIYKDAQGRVAKTFQLAIDTSEETPPSQWQVQLQTPLSFKFTGSTLSSLNRAEGENYDWYRGILQGEITLEDGQKLQGLGTFEFINEF